MGILELSLIVIGSLTHNLHILGGYYNSCFVQVFNISTCCSGRLKNTLHQSSLSRWTCIELGEVCVWHHKIEVDLRILAFFLMGAKG